MASSNNKPGNKPGNKPPKPAPSFTMTDLLEQIMPKNGEEGDFFTTAELSLKFNRKQSAILEYLKRLEFDGWEVERGSKRVATFDRKPTGTMVPAYRIVGRVGSDLDSD